MIAAAGRWRHSGSRIGLAQVAATRLIFNVNGGQTLEWRRDKQVTRAVARCGGVSVAEHGDEAVLEVDGRGDTLQLLIDPLWLDRLRQIGKEQRAAPEHALQLLALSAQALVALAGRAHPTIHEIVGAAASLMIQRPGETRPMTRGGMAPAVLRRVKELVEAQLDRDAERIPSVRELAERSDISLHHFIRAFKVSEGVTPHSWIVTRRLEKAIALLVGDHVPVTDAAALSGYSSAAHFIDGFCKTLGVTPGQLRIASLAS